MDEQLRLCEVHPTLLIHMELGKKGYYGVWQMQGMGRPLVGAPPVLPYQQTHHKRDTHHFTALQGTILINKNTARLSRESSS